MSKRLTGIDMCRGLAAFAVILVHSGDETWGLPISSRAIQFRYLFYYAVPFFLAASFYLSIQKSPLKIDRSFWQKKFQRIVVPYLLWSTFYLVSKTAMFLFANDTQQLRELFADPVAIIFGGAASYHLYFIPLLLSGTLLLYLTNYLQRTSQFWLFLGCIGSIILYQLLTVTQNDFNLDSYTAFPQWLELASSNQMIYQVWRVALLCMAWCTRCLPYLFSALLLNKWLEKGDRYWLYEKETTAAIFMIFLLFNIVGSQYLPGAFNELFTAYSLLLFGITLSANIADSELISNLGVCSFGIYLIHPTTKSAVEVVLVKLLPQIAQSVSIPSMLIYSSVTFLLSWVFISLLQNYRLTSQST